MARETQGSPAGEKKLEQYGVWVKVKPREVTELPENESPFELSDLEAPKSASAGRAASDENTLTDDEEKLLNELESELGPEEGSTGAGVPEEEPLLAEEEELPDIETAGGESASPTFEDAEIEELPEMEEVQHGHSARAAGGQKAGARPRETGDVEVTLSEDALEEDRFDDLEALESELASVATTTRKVSSSSSEILAKIEDELRSIRKDLTELRGELSGLRKGAGAPVVEAPAAGAADAQSGFFDEDEDETIALTGDELDNILNTADITEETAETPSVESDLDALGLAEETAEAAPAEDTLSFDTPSLEEDALVPAMDDLQSPAETLESEDTLSLAEEAGGDSGAATLEELPSELVLEELDSEPLSVQPAPADDVEELPGLDMEGIAEIEMDAEEALSRPSPAREADSQRSNETIDLETLDLGEEPTVIEAVPEQVDDLDTVEEAELMDEEASGGIESDTAEVDLEALASEAETLTDDVALAPAEDLEIGELESVTDETEAVDSSEKEIEIEFESEPDALSQTSSASGEIAGMETGDQILEAEEVLDEEPARSPPSSDGAAGIPDNLKDELRTVLGYMDKLLEALPDEKIQEFASSDYFVMYKKLFEDLGIGE
jgi:pilus assembly protein FimV